MEKSENGIIPAQRLTLIMQYMEENKSAQIKELSDYLGVSEATVRRDLTILDKEGSIERTHGGAILSGQSTSFERIYSEKLKLDQEEKMRIGNAAAAMVNDGDTVFLDSGTTTFQIAKNLERRKNLTIITYDLFIASAISLDPSSILIVTGGIKREGFNVLVGAATEKFIRGLKVSKVFLAADAVDVGFGVSNANYMEAGAKSLIVESGDRTILVADHTKFGKTALAKVCELASVDTIITDHDLPQKTAQAIEQLGIELSLV